MSKKFEVTVLERQDSDSQRKA